MPLCLACSCGDAVPDGHGDQCLHVGGADDPLLGPAGGQCHCHICNLPCGSSALALLWGHSLAISSTLRGPSPATKHAIGALGSIQP